MRGTPRLRDPQGRSLPDSVELGPAGDPGLLHAEFTALRASGAPPAAVEGRLVLGPHSPGGDPGRSREGANTCYHLVAHGAGP